MSELKLFKCEVGFKSKDWNLIKLFKEKQKKGLQFFFQQI